MATEKSYVSRTASLFGWVLLTGIGRAETGVDAKMAALDAAVKSAQSAGDNAWMLVSAALVLMMTGPGLALFYGGLVRKKNMLGTMMQSFMLMAVITVLWALVGYSLAFGEGTPFIGDLRYAVPARRRQRARMPITRARFRSRPSWCTS